MKTENRKHRTIHFNHNKNHHIPISITPNLKLQNVQTDQSTKLTIK